MIAFEQAAVSEPLAAPMRMTAVFRSLTFAKDATPEDAATGFEVALIPPETAEAQEESE